MGTDGVRTVIVNSVGPRDGRARRGRAGRGPPRAAHDRLRPAEGGRGRVQGARATTAPPSCSIRGTARCSTFASLPAYDPNRFAAGIDRATWAALNTDELRPLQNRAIQGRYSPGSTFKMAVATAALEEGVVTPDFRVHCSGRRRCSTAATSSAALKGGHGTVDMRHAIEKSCNVYFYTLGNMLGVDRIHKWATRLGLGVQQRHRPAQRGAGHHAVDRVEEGPHGREVVRRRDDLGGHRAGTGLGDADVAGGV